MLTSDPLIMPESKRTLFKSVGLAFQDLVIAEAVMHDL